MNMRQLCILNNQNKQRTKQDELLISFINKNYYNGTLWLHSKNWQTQGLRDGFKRVKELIVKGLTFEQLEISQFQLCKQIQNISFPTLQILDLKSNNIQSIQTLAHLQIPKVKMLILSDNKITALKSLRKLNAPELNTIHLQKNQIMDFSGLEYLNCDKLKRLILDSNFQWEYLKQKDMLFKLNAPKLMKIEGKANNCYYKVPKEQMKEIQLKIRSKLQQKFSKLSLEAKAKPFELVREQENY